MCNNLTIEGTTMNNAFLQILTTIKDNVKTLSTIINEMEMDLENKEGKAIEALKNLLDAMVTAHAEASAEVGKIAPAPTPPTPELVDTAAAIPESGATTETKLPVA